MFALRSWLAWGGLLLAGCAPVGGVQDGTPPGGPAFQPLAGAPHIRHEPGRRGPARRLAGRLTAARSRVAAALGMAWRLPVVLRVCGSRACMARTARHPERNAESSRGGLLFGPGAFRRPVRLERILSHELVHALFRQYLGSRYWQVPAWFHEGVAVMVSGNGAGGVTPAAARRALHRGQHFSFYCRRDPLGFGRGFRPGDQLHYRQAEMFVRHLRSGDDARFRRLIAGVLRGADLCASYVRVYGQPLPAVWAAFRRG